MKQNETQNTSNKFDCLQCDFICSKKGDWNRHILTSKHKMMQNETHITSSNAHTCIWCGSIFNSRTTIWRHKKKCNNMNVDASNNIIIDLLKQNNEFKELLIEQNKKIIEITEKGHSNNITNYNNTINNNQFNLQFFLNETCKDALNIDEFVNQIQLQLSDLDMIGKVGYVEGITKIFLRNLKALDVCKRPIHCSDLKREVLYIKDKGSWEKDNDQNVKIKRVIKGIEDKNIKQLPQWRAENPTHEDTETKKHMEYVHILIESMGGTPIEDDNKRLEKIIRNIAKEVVIDKSK